jgi:hypothetical protein
MRCRSIQPGDLSCTPESCLLPLMSLVNGIPSFPSSTCSMLLLLDICALLGYYAPYSGNSFSAFRDNLSVPCARKRNHRRNRLLLLHLSLFFLLPLRPSLKEKVQRIKQVVDEKRGPRPVSYFLVVLRVVIGYRIIQTGPLWGSDMRLDSEPDANTVSICCRQWMSRDEPPQ